MATASEYSAQGLGAVAAAMTIPRPHMAGNTSELGVRTGFSTSKRQRSRGTVKQGRKICYLHFMLTQLPRSSPCCSTRRNIYPSVCIATSKMVRHRLRKEDAGAVSQASAQRTKRGRFLGTGSGGEDASHPEKKRGATYKHDIHLGQSSNRLVDVLGATALSKNETEGKPPPLLCRRCSLLYSQAHQTALPIQDLVQRSMIPTIGRELCNRHQKLYLPLTMTQTWPRLVTTNSSRPSLPMAARARSH